MLAILNKFALLAIRRREFAWKILDEDFAALTFNSSVRYITSSMPESLIEPKFEDDKVYVQNDSDRKMLTLSFQYSTNGKTRIFNLFRKQDETVSDTLRRIQYGIIKLTREKKKTSPDPMVVNVALKNEGQLVDYENTIAKDAWCDGAILTINDKSYEVRSDFPQVDLLSLPTYNMHNSIMMPAISLKNCDLVHCKFIWQRQLTKPMKEELASRLCLSDDAFEFDMGFYWYKLADTFFYYSTEDDIGRKLKVVCYPSDGIKFGPPVCTITNNPIEIGPSSFPFEKRHELTKSFNESKDEFRILTYNILADLYADSEYSRTVLFKYCPTHALHIDYRRQILLREISGYHCDIMCLQEVDKKEYNKVYENFFKISGSYSSVFDTKGGNVAEGLATFYRDSKFELVESHATLLSSLISLSREKFDGEKVPGNNSSLDNKNDIKPKIRHPILRDNGTQVVSNITSKLDGISSAIVANHLLYKRFMERQTVLQTSLVRLKHKPNFYLIIANTHLYFAPDADHIRLLQASVCLKYIEFLKDYYHEKLTCSLANNQDQVHVNVVLCGDMNSSPDCGLYQLARTGLVVEDCKDWSSNKEESVSGLRVETGLRFESAYKDIDYTNYTPNFNGCLDYIYYENKHMECKSTLPMPEHEVVIAGEGIPSAVFPSDHLALVAEIRFT